MNNDYEEEEDDDADGYDDSDELRLEENRSKNCNNS